MPDTTVAPDPTDPADPTGSTDATGSTDLVDELESGPVVYLPPERGLLRRSAPVGAAVAAVVVLVLVLGGWWIARQVNPPGGPGKAVTVAIPDGSNDAQIANLMAKRGVVTNATVFRYYLKLTGAGPFKAGVYDGLHLHEAMSAVVKRLDGEPMPPPTRTLLIPEGLWLSEIRARILKTFPEMKPADLDQALATVRSRYEPPGTTSLEGFLFPATYQVLEADVANPHKLVQQMVTKFDQEGDSVGLSQSAAKVGLTPYQVLTVASMVEEEAKIPGDRPKIARVILNRLARHMSLGLDTTVEYALQQRILNITNAQLAVNSPYNTRTHVGLTPTPISSPGVASLEAALNPAAGNWLYFVLADKSGAQYFTNSYSDFQRATAQAKAAGLFGG